MERISLCGLAVLLTSGLIGAAVHVEAETACGPIAGSDAYVNSTTYYFCNPASGLHEALDICNGRPCAYCGCDGNQSAWHRAMLIGLKLYRYNGGGQNPPICPNNCEGRPQGCGNIPGDNCNGGAGNYFTVIGSNGWDFRQLHLNHSAVYSYTKYADVRNILGHWGSTGNSSAPHAHADNRLNGVRRTAWYENYGITCNSPGHYNAVIGYPQLQ